MASLSAEQKLNRETHAVHAAGFWTSGRGLVAVREDVGRLLTSRVSIELIQKAARLGALVVTAVSAPTAAGVRLAENCGITLVAIARG